MRPGLQGIEIDTTIFRPATFVEVALGNLLESLLIGAILVIVILLIFLWDWRIALISATIIPVTVVITLLVLSFFDTTLNVMVLAGLVIAIGAVVDDAIVDVENIVRRLRQHRQQGSSVPTGTIVLDASVEVRNAIVNASLIEMTSLLPVFFMEGLSGAFFPAIGTSVCGGNVGFAVGSIDGYASFNFGVARQCADQGSGVTSFAGIASYI